MEKYYIKKPNGRYEYAGYSTPNMYEGLYFHQKTGYGSRTTSIAYWVGKNPEEPVDIDLLVGIMNKDGELAEYIGKLQDPDSVELKELKEENGHIRGPLEMYNWSRHDLAVILLRFIYNKLKEKNSAQKER